MQYQTDELEVRFTVPAFLGGADQSAEWRVPPFKALLRQCWRIVEARRHEYDWKRLRESEGRLFGNAWLASGTSRSRVQVALSSWDPGRMGRWPKDPLVVHPEVRTRNKAVGAHLYLGYGPLNIDNGRTGLKYKRAIDVNARPTRLRLRYPRPEEESLEKVLALAHLVGAVGGRSRNGWGSFELLRKGQPLLGIFEEKSLSLLRTLAVPLADCLERDWPHAIGKDENGLLLWTTPALTSWEEVTKHLAELKIAFRTQFGLKSSSHQAPEERHVLAYPVTNHSVNSRNWKSGRNGNQLRFKVAREGARWRGIVVHIPCSLPANLRQDVPRNWPHRELDIWRRVHKSVDARLTRIEEDR